MDTCYLRKMYLRTTRRQNKDGSIAEYYQLAHNERHPDTGKPVAKIIHNFGRTDNWIVSSCAPVPIHARVSACRY